MAESSAEDRAPLLENRSDDQQPRYGTLDGNADGNQEESQAAASTPHDSAKVEANGSIPAETNPKAKVQVIYIIPALALGVSRTTSWCYNGT